MVQAGTRAGVTRPIGFETAVGAGEALCWRQASISTGGVRMSAASSSETMRQVTNAVATPA